MSHAIPLPALGMGKLSQVTPIQNFKQPLAGVRLKKYGGLEKLTNMLDSAKVSTRMGSAVIASTLSA